MTLRIVIADDHGVLRAGLRAVLGQRADLEVVGEAGGGEEALRLVETLEPDLLLADVSMPPPDGIQIARKLSERGATTRVLILTVHEDSEILREALRAGASGYVVKRALASELLNAIDAAARGDIYVHPSVTHALLQNGTKEAEEPPRGAYESLTPRETQVLGLIARGYTNSQIAGELGLSIRTVEGYRSNLMGKLGLRTRAELVEWAIAKGLLPVG